MTSSQEPSKNRNEDFENYFKPWRCGDPYNFPLPKTDGDPWTVVLDYLTKKDQVRCEAWKDEVQNLLIFAGLFSAVVTAFVVESYKSLQQDSGDMQTILLSRILSQLDNTTTPFSNLGDQSFSPAASNIRVNALWFLSLIFSLATVLVGIICLQWVREHQRPAHDVSPRIAVSLLQMQIEALERWYVPHFFSALPLLLQIGLVCFFAGLIDFLWHINHTVAIPVLVAAGFTLLFLLLTTILPAAQNILQHLPQLSSASTPRSPCSYRSPQSWVFVRLVASFASLRNRIAPFVMKHIQVGFIRTWFRRYHYERSLTAWLKHAMQWLYRRDLDVLSKRAQEALSMPRYLETQSIVPVYDSVQALLQITDNLTLGSQHDHIRVATHNCLEELSPATSLPLGQTVKLEYRFYIDTLLHINALYSHCIRPPLKFTAYPERLNIDSKDGSTALVLQDCNSFLFGLRGGVLNCKTMGPRALRRHRLELCIRITEWLFAHGPQTFSDEWQKRLEEMMNPILWDSLHEDDMEDIDISPQIVYILERFFEHAASSFTIPRAHEGITSTSYTSLYTRKFLQYASEVITNRRHPLSGRVQSQHELILTSITNRVRKSITSDTKCDYLFVVSTLYFQSLYETPKRNSDSLKSTRALDDLVLALKAYKFSADANPTDTQTYASLRALSNSINWGYEWLCHALERAETDTLYPEDDPNGRARLTEKQAFAGASEKL